MAETIDSLDPIYYVNVGKHGTFKKSGDFFSTPQTVDNIFATLVSQNEKKMVIHFHGGLVSEKSGMETAKMMTEVYKRANSHPVSFIWETGFFETIKYNIDTIHKTKLFQKILGYVIKAAGKQLGINVDGKGIENITDEEIARELAKDVPFARMDGGARGGAGVLTEDKLNAEIGQMMENEIEEMVMQDMDLINDLLATENQPESIRQEKIDTSEAIANGKGGFMTIIPSLIKIAYQVVKRYINKRDHGFYPTILEEILREFYIADFGGWLWSDMKEAAEGMWAKNDGLAGAEMHGGTYFLDKLDKLMGDNPDFVVDLVGHSAGSIAICHMLSTISTRYNNIKIRNIAFLAPACTIKLFTDEIVKQPGRYKIFRMYTMQDSYEIDDNLIPLPVLKYLYPRSLLYFISGILEDEADKPLAGMDRFITNNGIFTGYPFDDSRAFLLNNVANRLVLSVTNSNALPGFRSTSKDHGAFDNDVETQNSLVYLFSN